MEHKIAIFLTTDELRQIITESVQDALKSQRQPEAAPARKSMTVDEVAAFIGLSKSTIYIKTMRGLIPHYKRDKRVFFERDEIEAWLLENKRITTAEAAQQADKYIASKLKR
jgi:excisionase family DNA binding protein